MAPARSLALAATLVSLALACQPKDDVSPEPKKAHHAAARSEHEKSEPKPEAESPEPGKYLVPFAWEAERDEPLAQTRAFMAEVLSDNQAYMEHGDKFFARFADKQTPRATVLTCADSRVQTGAWDVTPENDDFVIRNIGNQVENAEGSLEYGVEHLGTPLLLIVGHTGCGAVQAAMGDTSKLSPAIHKELEHLELPKSAPGRSPEAAWAEAVIANVNNQVAAALKHFGQDVQTGHLTVVGAVYDFRNDLRQGAGKLSIVNVNGNSETERMEAFVNAVSGKKEDPKDKRTARGAHFDDAQAAAEIAAQIAKLRRPEPSEKSEHAAGAH